MDIETANIIGSQIKDFAGIYLTGTQAELATALATLLLFLVIAKLSDMVFEKVLKRITSKTKTKVDDKIVDTLSAPVFHSIIILGAIISLDTISFIESAMSVLKSVANTAIILIWTLASSRIAAIFIKDILSKVTEKTKSTIDNEMLPLFNNIAKILIYFIGLTMILSVWNIELTPFLATAGVAGLAIAFAAQNTISHLFGGISVYFDKPFRVGDRIQLESGEYGDVTEIGIRSTRILTLDDTLIVIPNDTIANSKIINYHAPYSRIKVKLRLGVVYGSDVAKVKKTLLKVAKSIPEVQKDPEPLVLFTEHGDFSLKFLLITWVARPELKGEVTDKLNTGIDREFRKEGIEMAFPTQTIYTISRKK